jgi:hypothetical protein
MSLSRVLYTPPNVTMIKRIMNLEGYRRKCQILLRDLQHTTEINEELVSFEFAPDFTGSGS